MYKLTRKSLLFLKKTAKHTSKKKRKGILTIKYLIISLQEALKEVTNYTKNTYATITQQANKMHDFNGLNQIQKYQTLKKQNPFNLN